MRIVSYRCGNSFYDCHRKSLTNFAHKKILKYKYYGNNINKKKMFSIIYNMKNKSLFNDMDITI